MSKIEVISEIGINHNGSIDLAKNLILQSHISGATFVKFQKRTPEICIPENMKDQIKSTPWGEMTYLEYKKKIEFDEAQVAELFRYADEIGIKIFASVWDIPSAKLMSNYTKICKIPSALLTNIELCKYSRRHFNKLIISTGMSSETEIEKCIHECDPDVIMHSVSIYPTLPNDLNLRYITHLREKYVDKEIGYSGHEMCIETTYAAVCLGATWIERHFTNNKEQWGSDQKSSIEPHEFSALVKGINLITSSLLQPSSERKIHDQEMIKRTQLAPTSSAVMSGEGDADCALKMCNGVKILCIIPARCGSKSIPHKNILIFKGKTLLENTIIQALNCRYDMKIVVSTDNSEYAEIAKKAGAEIPFLRPNEISTDESTDFECIKHCVDWYNINQNLKFDVVLHLRVTSPLRTTLEIEDALEIFINNRKKYSSLRSVIVSEKSACKMYYIENDTLIPFVRYFNNIHEPINQCRQMLPTTYVHNGYIDIFNANILIQNSISGEKIYPYIMNLDCSIDIDTYKDIEDMRKRL